MINEPLAIGFTPEMMDDAWNRIEPRIMEFQPQLIFLSAGFDAHVSDPAKGGTLTTESFSVLTHKIINMSWQIESCRGRVVSVLEGGYDVESDGALQQSVKAHVEALLDARQPQADEQDI